LSGSPLQSFALITVLAFPNIIRSHTIGTLISFATSFIALPMLFMSGMSKRASASDVHRIAS
jgi:hypothetical protein